MKIGVYQFRGSADLTANHDAIKRAIHSAFHHKVRLLAFQECATCGYPPVETPSVDRIDYGLLDSHLLEIQQLAKSCDLYIALGTIRVQDSKRYNTILLIGPDGHLLGHYDKRALWGWDTNSFVPGQSIGLFDIDSIKIGFHICFEVRFPEYFRELFRHQAELCIISFCDVSAEESLERYELIKSHLITRAAENVMTVISVNSISQYQTAPTAVFDYNGNIVLEAQRNREQLLVYDYTSPKPEFGAKGRLHYSHMLLSMEDSEKV